MAEWVEIDIAAGEEELVDAPQSVRMRRAAGTESGTMQHRTRVDQRSEGGEALIPRAQLVTDARAGSQRETGPITAPMKGM